MISIALSAGSTHCHCHTFWGGKVFSLAECRLPEPPHFSDPFHPAARTVLSHKKSLAEDALVRSLSALIPEVQRQAEQLLREQIGGVFLVTPKGMLPHVFEALVKRAMIFSAPELPILGSISEPEAAAAEFRACIPEAAGRSALVVDLGASGTQLTFLDGQNAVKAVRAVDFGGDLLDRALEQVLRKRLEDRQIPRSELQRLDLRRRARHARHELQQHDGAVLDDVTLFRSDIEALVPHVRQALLDAVGELVRSNGPHYILLTGGLSADPGIRDTLLRRFPQYYHEYRLYSLGSNAASRGGARLAAGI